MEKKYYDLIISIIKNHRKYTGLESILEEIAQDVYEKSNVVISSISDDKVLNAYLEKIVSISIVTVPKSLNISTRSRKSTIDVPIIEPISNVMDEESIIREEVSDTISEENLINDSEKEVLEEIVIKEEDLNVQDSDDLSLEIETELNIENMFTDNAQDVDRDLIDKMINGVDSDILVMEIEQSNDSNEEAYVSDSEGEELLSEIDDIDNLVIEELEQQEIVNEIIEQNISIDSFSDSELELENDLVIDEVIVETLSEEEEEENIVEITKEESIQTEDCKKTDDILSYLKQYAESISDEYFLKVCDLKYNKQLSVSDIAEELSIPIDEVITILNKVLDIVKDY